MIWMRSSVGSLVRNGEERGSGVVVMAGVVVVYLDIL